MANILLLGGGLQVLSIACSLVEVGHTVNALNEHNKISKKSRYVNKCIEVDFRDIDVDKFVDIIIRENYDVIIPMEDPHADWLSFHKKEIEDRCYKLKCAVPDYDVFQLGSDKGKLLTFCEERGLGVPKTRLIGDDWDVVADYVGFPALIKPNHSAGARGIVLVNNMEEFKTKAPMIIAEYGESSLQEYLCSKDYYYNVMMYRTKDGRFGNHCIIKIIRYYPIKGGSSSLSVTVDNAKLVKQCKEVLDALNWVGFADFDILEKGEDDYRIIEINPRVPASVRGAAMSGINYGEMIVADCMGKELPVYEYHTGRYLRYLGLDICWFFASPKRFSFRPSWFWFFGKDLYYMEGGKKDWRAMLASIWSGIKKQLNSEFRRQKSGMN